MKERFCFNEKCGLYDEECDPETRYLDVDTPNVASVIIQVHGTQKERVHRHVLINSHKQLVAKLCDSCQGAVQMIAPLGQTG